MQKWNRAVHLDSTHRTRPMSASSKLFERVPLREAPSSSSHQSYGATKTITDTAAGIASEGNIRNSIGGGIKPAGVELRRFSASTSLPIESVLLGDESIRVREKRSGTEDEFNVQDLPPEVKMSNIAKTLRTGRQRKKTAARTKGGEFQARRKKRRVYFCCISNDIDVEKLADEFQIPHFGMTGQMYDEVLHLTVAREGGAEKGRTEEDGAVANTADSDLIRLDSGESNDSIANPIILSSPSVSSNYFGIRQPALLQLNPRATHPSFEVSYKEDTLLNDGDLDRAARNNRSSREGEALSYLHSFEEDGYPSANEGEFSPIGSQMVGFTAPLVADIGGALHHVPGIISETEHSKEVFVFGFGAAVFWGLAKSEVQDLLQYIAQFIVKDRLSTEEFEAGEDDMAFVTDYDTAKVSIANDVVTLPPLTTVKERLALSFAIAQSAVLTIFEARVEKKIEEYKYIPETLAGSGKVDLSPKQLGTMIGEVFVMQHDVNLHSEILDLPDYFWKENQVEPLYRMTMSYMEMEPRISVLNKRLDLMRQLLRVLQQQHENAHSVKLEWIVIWLIVISCVLEMWDIIKDVLGLHGG